MMGFVLQSFLGIGVGAAILLYRTYVLYRFTRHENAKRLAYVKAVANGHMRNEQFTVEGDGLAGLVFSFPRTYALDGDSIQVLKEADGTWQQYHGEEAR